MLRNVVLFAMSSLICLHTTVASAGLAFNLLIDVSASVRKSDPDGAAKDAAITVYALTIHDQARVGVDAFASEMLELAPMGKMAFSDLPRIREKILQQQLGGGTNLVGAIEARLKQQIPADDILHMIVVTDGEIPEDQTARLRELAQVMVEKRIVLHAIVVGNANWQLLAELTKTTGGLSFGISSAGDDCIRDARNAAIELVLQVLPNQLFVYSDANTPLQIPREAARIVSIVPPESRLSRGSVTAGVDATESRHGGWTVTSIARPTDEAAIKSSWVGDWHVMKEGVAGSGWHLIRSDIRITADASATTPSADAHTAVQLRVAATNAVGANRGQPLTVRAYFKPEKGPAYPAASASIMPPLPASTELMLSPVPAGTYQLVSQVLNTDQVLCAESRQKVTVNPALFTLLLRSGGKVVLDSGTVNRTATMIPYQEPFSIEVVPATSLAEVEEIAGIVSRDDVHGISKPVGSMRIDRDGPRLFLDGLRLEQMNQVFHVNAVVKLSSAKLAPVGGVQAVATRRLSGSWSFALTSGPRPEPEQSVVHAESVTSPVGPVGSSQTVAWKLFLADGFENDQVAVLNNVAKSLKLTITDPAGKTIELSNALIGTINSERLDAGSRMVLPVEWTFRRMLPGTHSVKLGCSTTSAAGGKQAFVFVPASGQFVVDPPWILAELELRNRQGGKVLLADHISLRSGDDVSLSISPSSSFPSHLIENAQVEAKITLNGGPTRLLSMNRPSDVWLADIGAIETGRHQLYVDVHVQGGVHLTRAVEFDVRTIEPKLHVPFLPEHLPVDALLQFPIDVEAQDSSDVEVVRSESELQVQLLDETEQPVKSHLDVSALDVNGRAICSLRFPRQGVFRLKVGVGKQADVARRIIVGPPGMGVRGLTAKSDAPNKSLLAAPAFPPQMRVGEELTIVALPTPEFPYEGFRIVAGAIRTNGGEDIPLTDDGRDRWHSPTIKISEAGFTGEIRLQLTSTDGVGLQLVQPVTFEPKIIHSWFDYSLAMVFVLLAVYAACLLYRRMFGLAGVTVSLIDPYLPNQVLTANRLRSLFWPQVTLAVQASMLPGNQGKDGNLFILDRPARDQLRARILSADGVVTQDIPLNPDRHVLRVQNCRFEIRDSRRSAAPGRVAATA